MTRVTIDVGGTFTDCLVLDAKGEIHAYGILVPKATPREIVQRLNREIANVLAVPEIRHRLTNTGFEVVASSPETFDERIRNDYELYGKVARDAGIKPQ